MNIVSNLVFYEMTKNIEAECHVVWEKIVEEKMNEKDIWDDLFTKLIGRSRVQFICNKLGIYDLPVPAWAEELRNSLQ